MNEIDLGRLLPLVVVWIIWLLITRRRGKEQEDAPVQQPPAGKIRVEKDWERQEELDAYPPEYEPAEIYYHPVPPSFAQPAKKECPEPRQISALKAGAPAMPPVAAYRAGVSRKELRRLMVWSEIIAPPLGMREKGER